MMAEQQKTVDVQVLSAFPLGSAEISKLSASLEKKLGRKVKLASEVDASLLGGVVIKAGDMVIDGSVRGRLARLARQVA
jgi:F-type H+-transporting ATPase subunit delta